MNRIGTFATAAVLAACLLAGACIGPAGACISIHDDDPAFCNNYNAGMCKFINNDEDDPGWTWEHLRGGELRRSRLHRALRGGRRHVVARQRRL